MIALFAFWLAQGVFSSTWPAIYPEIECTKQLASGQFRAYWGYQSFESDPVELNGKVYYPGHHPSVWYTDRPAQEQKGTVKVAGEPIEVFRLGQGTSTSLPIDNCPDGNVPFEQDCNRNGVADFCEIIHSVDKQKRGPCVNHNYDIRCIADPQRISVEKLCEILEGGLSVQVECVDQTAFPSTLDGTGATTETAPPSTLDGTGINTGAEPETTLPSTLDNTEPETTLPSTLDGTGTDTGAEPETTLPSTEIDSTDTSAEPETTLPSTLDGTDTGAEPETTLPSTETDSTDTGANSPSTLDPISTKTPDGSDSSPGSRSSPISSSSSKPKPKRPVPTRRGTRHAPEITSATTSSTSSPQTNHSPNTTPLIVILSVTGFVLFLMVLFAVYLVFANSQSRRAQSRRK